MIFYIEGLLAGPSLAAAQALVKKGNFISGKATADVGSEVKNNFEMAADEAYLELMELLDRAVESSDKINNRLLPRSRVRPIVNRYDVGMYFKEHVDAPIQGGQTQFGRAPGRFGQNFMRTDYSMTLFLNAPDEYEGGELELSIEERAEVVKLPAGSAVCYQTGIPHSVRPITRGSRIAAIYWFQSLIRDSALRRTLWDLHRLETELRSSGQGEQADRAQSIKSNFIRYLAEI